MIDRLAKDSRVLMVLPFEDLLGNSLTYNTITTDSTATFHAPGDTWSEDTPLLTQATVTLKILGDDADIDNFIKATRSNHIDIQGLVLANKIKAVKNQFIDTFYYGATTSDANSFDGLQTLMTSTTYNTVHAGSGTGTALSILKLREAIDLIRGYTPELMVMSKQLRRYIDVYLDSIGTHFPQAINKWGTRVKVFDEIEVYTDDLILNTETAASGAYTAKTGGGNTTIFILSFAPQAVCGVQGQAGVQTVPLGELETKDATRFRIKWYCGLEFEDLRSAAKVDGVDADGTVTA